MKFFLCVLCVLCGSPAFAQNAQITIHVEKPISPPLVGFGAQLNPYLYCKPNTPQVNDQNVKDYEQKVVDLAPQHVRIFCLNRWFFPIATTEPVAGDDQIVKKSFIRTVELAQRAGATINLTLWYGPFSLRGKDVPAPPGMFENTTRQFVQILHELIDVRKLTNVHYVTIQNEVNGEGDTGRHFKLDPPEYEAINRALDAELRKAGLRDKIKIVGGDLLMREQEIWVPFLGQHLADICDGWSMHAYWDYWDDGKIERRINGVADLVAALPANQQRPMYATEFGVRGHRAELLKNDPGDYENGNPIATTPLQANQMARFIIESLRRGYVADVAWNMDDSLYDHPMKYGLLGSPKDNWPIKPAYNVIRLFTHTTEPGWHTIDVECPDKNIRATATRGPKGQLTLYLLNITTARQTATVAGLPNRTMHEFNWNAKADGTSIDSGETEATTFHLRPLTLIVLTSK